MTGHKIQVCEADEPIKLPFKIHECQPDGEAQRVEEINGVMYCFAKCIGCKEEYLFAICNLKAVQLAKGTL